MHKIHARAANQANKATVQHKIPRPADDSAQYHRHRLDHDAITTRNHFR